MSTLTITIGIIAPVITFLIGRYFRAVKAKELDKVSKARDCFEGLYKNEREYAIEVKKLLDESMQLSSDRNKKVLELQTDLSESENLLYDERTRKHPKFQLVANKDKHPAANDNYLYIEGDVNGNREAGLLKLSDWSKAKERLLKNPEDKPL